MDTLLIFFAFPIAVIIISAILEKLLKNPIAVAAFIFAIFLIVTFAAFDETFLIATLVYTIIAFITAVIVHFLKRNCPNEANVCEILASTVQNNCANNGNNCNTENLPETAQNLLVSNSNDFTNLNNCGCGCGRCRRR